MVEKLVSKIIKTYVDDSTLTFRNRIYDQKELFEAPLSVKDSLRFRLAFIVQLAASIFITISRLFGSLWEITSSVNLPSWGDWRAVFIKESYLSLNELLVTMSVFIVTIAGVIAPVWIARKINENRQFSQIDTTLAFQEAL